MRPTGTDTKQKHANKLQAAYAALEFVRENQLVGIGTGSTVNCFIEALAASGRKIRGTVSSSKASTVRLRSHGFAICSTHNYEKPEIYVDGADEADPQLRLIKGGGGALTQEKILAEACPMFVCIADQSKQVETLGKFPLPVEIIPVAKRLVTETLASRSGKAQERKDFLTDNGNIILDVSDLSFADPLALERWITLIPGVVTVGLFAQRRADVLLLGTDFGVKRLYATPADSR